MKTHLVSFSTPQYRLSQKRLEASALKFGIDELHSFTEKSLKKSNFYKEHYTIFKQPRGFGYWLWKPYYILETLKKIDTGDVVLYVDAGNEVISNLQPLFDLCLHQDIVLFQVHTHKNKTWTKRDAFIGLECDEPKYYEAEQILGSPQLYRANEKSIEFVSTWLSYCQNIHLLTDLPNMLGEDNLPDFKDHRHDQSVLSLLALKRSVEIYRDPSQWGNNFSESFSKSLATLVRVEPKKWNSLRFPFQPVVVIPFGLSFSHENLSNLELSLTVSTQTSHISMVSLISKLKFLIKSSKTLCPNSLILEEPNTL